MEICTSKEGARGMGRSLQRLHPKPELQHLMSTLKSSARMADLFQNSPPTSVLERIRTLYASGRFLDAWSVASAPGLPPLRHWEGVEACLIGSRLARHLGSPRTATRLVSRAWQLAPQHPGVQHYRGLDWLDRRGAAGLRIAMMDWPAISGGALVDQADYLTLLARLASMLRDFRTADTHLGEARKLAPAEPWVRVEMAHCLADQDRVDEALEVMVSLGKEEAFRGYLPGLQMRGHLLQMLGRVDEALGLLNGSALAEQSATLHLQRYSLYHGAGRWQEANEALDRVESLSPLQELSFRNWLASQRVLVSHRLGDRFRALVLARELKDSFHKAFADRLQEMDAEKSQRVQLDVPFVRQDFKTCAPATLAALSAFWGRHLDHQKLAEAMCYDGTALWRQREWAEANGWITREFWVDRESVDALVRRGIPFALCTVDAFSSHMQAVIGTDPARDTWIIREPSMPHCVEYDVTALLKRFGVFGPHACLFLPQEEASRLDGLELPSTGVCESAHRITRALAMHDRAAAENEMQGILREQSEHPMRWHMAYQIACYDDDPHRQLESSERLLELYPSNELLQQRRISLLRALRPAEARTELDRIVGKPVAPLSLTLEYVHLLSQDVRNGRDCLQLLRRVLNRAGHHSGAVHAAASLLWNQGQLAASTDLFRIAAGMDGFQEGLFQSWYVACQQTGREAEALGEFEDRFRRLGSRSPAPGLTLAWAHLQQDDLLKCTEVLKEALQKLPDDGYLLLRAAKLEATPIHNAEEASRLLELAKGRVRNVDWWSAAGTLAEEREEPAEAVRCYRTAAELNPTDVDIQNALARCLSLVDGLEAVVAYVTDLVNRFPNHLGLRRLAVAWIRSHQPEKAEEPLREILRRAPGDSWAQRELASLLLATDRTEVALAQITETVARDPRDTRSLTLLGRILARGNRLTDANDAWRRAFALDPDQAEPMTLLLTHATSDAERQSELKTILASLGKQSLRGDSLFTLVEELRPIMEAEARLEILSSFHREHPDSWQAACVRVLELCHQGKAAEALPVARATVEHFSHHARTWMDLSSVYRSLGDASQELECARRAYDLGPWWPKAAHSLVEVLERQGALRPALEILNRAVRLNPRESSLRVSRARLTWRLGDKEAAIGELESAIRLTPSYDWSWKLLADWTQSAGMLDRVNQLTLSLTRLMPGDAHVWFRRALALLEANDRRQAVEALDRAVKLDRSLVSAWDLKAQVLVAAGQFDEASAACEEGRQHVRADRHVLEGRAAWIEAARGKTAAAVARMRSTLASNAGYTWGWGNLVVWLGQLKLHAEAREALERMRSLLPEDAWVHRQAGFISLQEGKRDAAISDFRKALVLNPADRPSAEMLFDLLLDAKELRHAAEVYEHLQLHLPGGETVQRGLFLCLRQSRKDDAIRALKLLCSSADVACESLAAAVNACLGQLPRSEVMAILRSVLTSALQSPHLPTCLLMVHDPGRHPLGAIWVFTRLPADARARSAAYLIQRFVASRRWLSLRLLFWTQRNALLATDAAWGQAGYALTSAMRSRAAVRWLTGWEERRGAEPWMVFNLCLSLTRMGRHSESLQHATRALDHWCQGEGVHSLRIFAAFEEALSGNLTQAGQLFNQVNPANLSPYEKTLHQLTSTMVSVHATPKAERLARLKSMLPELAAEFPFMVLALATKDLRRDFSRTGKNLRNATDSYYTAVWFTARLYSPLLLVLPVLAVCGIAFNFSPQTTGVWVVALTVLLWKLSELLQSE